jgi:polyvinyl alcohol dehydrogenase (cytochrome)
MGGHDLSNTRHASTGVQINSGNVGSLAVSWVFQTAGDVSATAAVDATSVYVPDWGGYIHSLDRKTGAVNWSRQVSEYAGGAGNFSRNTPAVHGNMLIFGDQGGRQFQGATLIAVDKHTGDLEWATALDLHPAAIVTQSPVVFGNTVFVGVASLEELFATDPNYPCCTFRGSVVALDVNTGAILWKTYMVPDIPGYSGNAVWGPTAAIDVKRRMIYVATGNNYTVPDDVLACVAANEGDPDAVAACLPADNYFDAVVALDVTTGAVDWGARALPFDAWTVACLFDIEELRDNCTSPSGPDLDFGEGPALFTIGQGPLKRDVVGAGQKSGQYWVFDRSTGALEWVTKAGPGGLLGGMIWGSAVDGERVYTAHGNTGHVDWGIVGGGTVDYGFWTAMDAATGEIMWQTPDPIAGNVNQGPVTTANDVVFACSMDVDGHMYALDAMTGSVLWSFASGGSCNAGAAVAGRSVYWGSGYSSLAGFLFPSPTGNDKFYAFELQK